MTFAPLFAPLYTFGMLSILNARTGLWVKKRHSRPKSQADSHSLIPGLVFTQEVTRVEPLEHATQSNVGPAAIDGEDEKSQMRFFDPPKAE